MSVLTETRLEGGPIANVESLGLALKAVTEEATQPPKPGTDLGETGRWLQASWARVLPGAQPERLKQWMVPNPCQTGLCLAGFGVSQAGAHMLMRMDGYADFVIDDAGLAKLRAATVSNRPLHQAPISPKRFLAQDDSPCADELLCTSIDGLAVQLFGLEGLSHRALFDENNSLHDLWAIAYMLTDGALAMPEGTPNLSQEDGATLPIYTMVVDRYDQIKKAHGRRWAMHLCVREDGRDIGHLIDACYDAGLQDQILREMGYDPGSLEPYAERGLVHNAVIDAEVELERRWQLA